MYGSSRRKATLLIHVVPAFLALRKSCDNQHERAKWGRTASGFATAEETQYPWPLAQTMSALLRQQLLDLGCLDSPQDLQGTLNEVLAARAHTGVQTSRRVLPLLVPEYKQRVVVSGTIAVDALLLPTCRAKASLSAPWPIPDSCTCSCSLAGHVVFAGSKLLCIQTSGGVSDAPSDALAPPAGLGPGPSSSLILS